MKRVFVGLSGGVDSSITALLLKRRGYDVTGVYMKNWSQNLPGVKCPWEDDYRDAKRVAVQLGIDFKLYDFEKEYKHRVVNYMVREYKAGRTPNPDVMCNQEVKFKLFLETALEDGADYIATGHYAKVKNGQLQTAADDNKDQTYFLYRITPEALKKVIFPLGELTKPQVRELAKKHNLVTADKKESMGICFVGNVGIKDFLSQYVTEKPGKIVNQHGNIVGEHEGAIFYTIGQRHGLDVGGGLPYYVIGKDMKKNEVYVTTDLQDKKLWNKQIRLSDLHWINGEPVKKESLQIRTRHRAKLIPAKLLDKRQGGTDLDLSSEAGKISKTRKRYKSDNLQIAIELEEEVRAITPGQSAVIYSGDKVLGGGIVI